MLKRKDFSVKDIRKKIEANQILLEWFVVTLHSKEREIKNKSRLFAMMVLEMRMYFASIEKNLANGIMKYLPTQTMTWSDVELSNYLLKMTSHEPDYIPITFSLDYEKFNQRWRYESTFDIFHHFDQLYGTKNL